MSSHRRATWAVALLLLAGWTASCSSSASPPPADGGLNDTASLPDLSPPDSAGDLAADPSSPLDGTDLAVPDVASADLGPGPDAPVADQIGDQIGDQVGDPPTADQAAPGGPCTFNRDCPAAQRCECTEQDGCACQLGVRGTGQSGVDTCQDGNDCESSLCLEGPGDVLTCSGPCASQADCRDQLPVCSAISGLGMICVRQSA